MISGKIVEVGHLTGVIHNSEANSLVGIIKIADRISGKIQRFIPEGFDIYSGEYVITPKPYDDQILETRGKLMINDVTVLQIPYYETSNTSGLTVYIGGE